MRNSQQSSARRFRRLPIPLRPLVAWLAAKRGLEVVPFPPDGTEQVPFNALAGDWTGQIVILDVGANVGSVAKRYASEFPGALIYCFEPVSTTFASLQRNTAGMHQVQCINAGVGDTDGEMEIAVSSDSGLSRFNAGDELEGFARHERVKVVTLDLLFETQNLQCANHKNRYGRA